jgi:hypothetical protein
MPRSGSTLVYNIVCHVVEKHLHGTRLGFADAGLLPEYRREVLDNRWRAIKTHVFDPGLKSLMDEGRATVFYIYRDLRDVLCSVMKHSGLPIDRSVSIVPALVENDRLWKADEHTLVQRYEDVVADVPHAVAEIAAHLHVSLSDGEASEIAAIYSIDANRARVEAIASRPRADGAGGRFRIDPHTLLLSNHIHTGQTGGWRTTLTESEVEAVHAVCGEWLAVNSYETGHDQQPASAVSRDAARR